MLIRLNLNLSPKSQIKTTRLSEGANPIEEIKSFSLTQCQAWIYYSKPSESHLAMLRDKLLANGVMHSPCYIWSGSYDKKHSAQNNGDDISSGASLLVKTYVTWVNGSEDANASMFTIADESNELAEDGWFGGNADGWYGALHAARFCPVFNNLRLSIAN